jgi:hypothetical protein
MRTSLAPVEAALLADAHRRALLILETEEAHGRAELAKARAIADALLEGARVGGESAAERQAAVELATTRREAHGLVLAARRQAYEALRRSALEEMERRAGTEEAVRLKERLAVLARTRLGEGATVQQGAPREIGIVAVAGNRVALVSLEELVDHHLALLAPQVEGLWA